MAALQLLLVVAAFVASEADLAVKLQSCLSKCPSQRSSSSGGSSSGSDTAKTNMVRLASGSGTCSGTTTSGTPCSVWNGNEVACKNFKVLGCTWSSRRSLLVAQCGDLQHNTKDTCDALASCSWCTSSVITAGCLTLDYANTLPESVAQCDKVSAEMMIAQLSSQCASSSGSSSGSDTAKTNMVRLASGSSTCSGTTTSGTPCSVWNGNEVACKNFKVLGCTWSSRRSLLVSESNGGMSCACQCAASYTAATSSQQSGDDSAAIVGSSVGAVAFVGAIAGVIYLKTRKPAEDQALHMVLVEDEVGL